VCAKPFCACRAFLKQDTCAADVCTHPYSSHDRASQPPFGLCTDATSDETACIGDDTVHAVFPGGYTWPNDPQTYVSDARAYRIIFAPGFIPGTSPAITNSAPVPDCSSFPEPYGYAAQRANCGSEISDGAIFAGAALSPTCTTNDDCPIIPGSDPPAHSACDTAFNRCATWACEIAPGGPVSTGDILCSWSAGAQTPTPTPTSLGGPPATRMPGAEDDGCAINPGNGSSSGGVLLALAAAAGALLRSRRRSRR
jgi:MYXO-CTERM domain-containing protein